jgi:hypothetical protein
MEVELNNITVSRDRSYPYDFIILSPVVKLDLAYIDKAILIRDRLTLVNYMDPDSYEYAELSQILNQGYTLLVHPRFKDEDSIRRSYLTPVGMNQVIPTKVRNSYKGLTKLVDPRNLTRETYVVNYRYDPNYIISKTDVSKSFYINIPASYISKAEAKKLDSEFTILVGIRTEDTPYADTLNDVLDLIIEMDRDTMTLEEIFDKVEELLENWVSRYRDYESENILNHFIGSYNDKVTHTFSVYYTEPVRYLPKTIHPVGAIQVSYGLNDNIDFLQDYLPIDTVTFKSKLVGKCSNLKLSYEDGVLTTQLGGDIEEFDVSLDETSSDFIGNIHSKYIEIKVNSRHAKLYEFSTQFTDVDLPELDVDSTIKDYIDSEFEINAIILSDTLYKVPPIDEIAKTIDGVTNTLIFESLQSGFDNFKPYVNNVIKFSGRSGKYPIYINVLDSIINFKYSDKLDEMPTWDDSFPFTDFRVISPDIQEYNNFLYYPDLNPVNYDFNLDLSHITIFHLFYAFAIEKFIARYKYMFQFKRSPLGSISDIISLLRSQFKIIENIEIISFEQYGNDCYVTLNTKFTKILKYPIIEININIQV